MKIAFPYNSWRGGFLNSIERSLHKIGHQTFVCEEYDATFFNKVLRKINLKNVSERAKKNNVERFNVNLLKQLKEFNPDFFFNISGGAVLPSTINKIQNKLNCTTVCLVADNPCDPASQRDKYFAMTLRYYDIILLPEPIWTKIIRNLAPNAKIIPFYGGYEPDFFFPIDKEEINMNDIQKYSCDVSFTGASYYENPEGSYRAGILGQLEGYKQKLWGDNGWEFRFQYYPLLKDAYQGERLDYNELRKLYTVSTINLNMPSPQILTGFQPRVFEIGASKGFQIVDHSEELYRFFKKEEIVTFKGLKDLKIKIDYYLKNESERMEITNNLYNKIRDNYTWEKQINLILSQVFLFDS